MESMRRLIADKAAQNGIRAVTAKQLGISVQYLGDILRANRDISAEVGRALGYQKVLLFVPTPKPKGRK